MRQHRKNMARALEASLKRLKTDYVDLYWVHAWDFMTPVEEVMRGLDDMVRAGKVLYVGISDTPAWIVSQANTLAQVHGWSPFVGLQVEYSLAQREPERDLLPIARAFDIGLTAWSPLAGGILSGKYAKGTKTNSDTARFSNEGNPPDERKLRIGETVTQLANEIGRSASQVSLNWLRQRQAVVIPIIGARRIAQIEDNLNSLYWKLTDEQLAKLDEATKIELGFPHDFLTNDFVRQMVFGGTHASIDNHRVTHLPCEIADFAESTAGGHPVRRTQLASFTRFAYSALPTVIATSGLVGDASLYKFPDRRRMHGIGAVSLF